MGKPKTQRTDKEIEQVATILAIGVDNGSIGLVEAIMAMPERKPEARRLTMKDIMDAKRAIEQEYAGGGASGKALPPKAAGGA